MLGEGGQVVRGVQGAWAPAGPTAPHSSPHSSRLQPRPWGSGWGVGGEGPARRQGWRPPH